MMPRRIIRRPVELLLIYEGAVDIEIKRGAVEGDST